MVDIVLDIVTKRFGNRTAVDALETTFGSSQVTCLPGPSGCGKARLMRMIAGLEVPTAGRILIDALDMRPLRNALIDERNTGLRQKVAVGHAVARQAEVVPFDEPTTDIEVDAKLTLIRAIKAVPQRLKQTIVYVTHGQTEAMTLADSNALMEKGRIVQQDAPRALYAAPRTGFAGWFLVSVGMNYLGTEVRD